jgi:hypothetical protein
VSYRGEHVGALCLPGGPESRLARDRRALLGDLAGRVGVILHNASLSIQLEHRLHEIEARSAELRASRLRIVATQDSERRDLERDLHDGAQPSLTAVRLALGLASHMGQVGNIAGARQALDELPGHINEALARLRQALRGLDPQIFGVQGLGEALASRRRRWAPVRCSASPPMAARRVTRRSPRRSAPPSTSAAARRCRTPSSTAPARRWR